MERRGLIDQVEAIGNRGPVVTKDAAGCSDPESAEVVNEAAVRSRAREPLGRAEQANFFFWLALHGRIHWGDSSHAAGLDDHPHSAIGRFAQPANGVATQAVLAGPSAGRAPSIEPRQTLRGPHPQRAPRIAPDAPDQVGRQALRFGPSFPFTKPKPTSQ